MKIVANYHSSIKINEDIYVDPLKISESDKAKFIFITHSHWDHFSVDDINKIFDNQTQIICPKSMENDMPTDILKNCIFVEPNSKYEVGYLNFKTFHSYNINKAFHKKEFGWVGYSLEIEGKIVTIVGDSDATPELKMLKTDILLVPIGGYYTMNYEEAAELTNLIKPQKVIPTHYGDIVGEINFADKFKNLINKDIVCEIQIR